MTSDRTAEIGTGTGIKPKNIIPITDTILVTTGRKPTANTRRFAKQIAEFINGVHINRGKSSLPELFELGYQRVLMIGQRHGSPAELIFYIDGVEALYLAMSLIQGEPYGRLKASDYTTSGDSLAQNLKDVLPARSNDIDDTDNCIREIIVNDTRINFLAHQKLLFSTSIKYIRMGTSPDE